MTTATICLPDTISETEARLLLAVKLFEVGRLSCGQAAEMAGFSKRAFVVRALQPTVSFRRPDHAMPSLPKKVSQKVGVGAVIKI